MTGGLIQLITIGKQDTPLINNPEITFFKNVYRQHTQFSISNNERYLDTKSFDTVGSKNIEKNGDLLLNMAFKLEIPYFEIVKNIKITQIIKDEYNLNSLDVNYLNTNCIVFYEKIQNKWIIIPENLFKLSFFEGIYYDINVNDLQKNLLPEYIKLIDLGENVKLYQTKYFTGTTSLISCTRKLFKHFPFKYIPFLGQYPLLSEVVGVVLLCLGLFLYGGYAVEMSWRDKVKEVEAKVEVAKKESEVANTKLETKIKEKQKVRVEYYAQIKERIVEKEKLIDAKCELDPEVPKLINAAATNPLSKGTVTIEEIKK